MNYEQDKNHNSEKWNKQEENEMKKQNEVSNYGTHRINELFKFNLYCK